MSDPHAKRIVDVFNDAIAIVDKSEPIIRNMIEQDMFGVAGVDKDGKKISKGLTSAKALSVKIAAVRHQHITAAFRHLREHLPSDV
jgi:hypothetical protein